MDPGLRNYHAANRTLLAFVVGSLLLCAALFALDRAWPGHFTVCASKRFLGIPCPLCGVTHGLDALLHGNPAAATAHNGLTIPIACALVIELVGRLVGSFVRLPSAVLPKVNRADFALHAAGFALYLIFSAVFYLRLFWRG